jgi:anti-sigma B factor antagonist
MPGGTVVPVDPLEFRLTSAHVADTMFVITLGGELDLANTSDVDRELELLLEGGARHVIVDLLDVPFLESTALGVLLRRSRELRENGGDLTLVTDDARVRRVIEIAGLAGYFRIVKTLREAIDSTLASVYS